MKLSIVTYASPSHYAKLNTLRRSIARHEPDALHIHIEGKDVQYGYPAGFYTRLLQEILVRFNAGDDAAMIIGADEVLMAPLNPIRELMADPEINIIVHSHVNHPCDIKPYHLTGMINSDEPVFKNTPESRRAIEWLLSFNLDEYDLSQAKFYDQIYVSALPFIFSGVKILRDDSYNVAFFNLHERVLTRDYGKLIGEYGSVLVNGQPLSIFHFTGFDGGLALSRHAPNMIPTGVLKELVDWYKEELNK